MLVGVLDDECDAVMNVIQAGELERSEWRGGGWSEALCGEGEKEKEEMRVRL